MYFPTYVPKLDRSVAALINSVCPTGVSDDAAFDDGYIVMLYGDDYGVELSDFNKTYKAQKASVLAVYGEVKGENRGAYIVESSSKGRDSDIVVITAYDDSGVILGAAVKKQNESYWSKLPDNLFDSVIGKTDNIDLGDVFGKTNATLSLNAVNRAVNIACTFSGDCNADIVSALRLKMQGGD